MTSICITGHQGTGKSTILKQLQRLGYTAYGLDEEKVAGYFNTSTNLPFIDIPQGLERNQVWRKDNVWRLDMSKLRKLAVANGKLTFYVGFATNIEDLWDICDEIIVIKLDDDITKNRLESRANNSFGKHPGELELAITNSKIICEKAKSYKSNKVHFVDGTLDITTVVSNIIKITNE